MILGSALWPCCVTLRPIPYHGRALRHIMWPNPPPCNVKSYTRKQGKNKDTKAVVVSRPRAVARVSVDALAAIPEELVWLASARALGPGARTGMMWRTSCGRATSPHRTNCARLIIGPSWRGNG